MTEINEQLALFIPLALGFTALSFIIYKNWKRSQWQLQFELRHNVLMTKHPLLFITGKRSLFYFLKYWNQIPEFLAAHGYEVYVLPLPWRKEKQRAHALLDFLQAKNEQKLKFHLVFDSSSFNEFSTLFKEHSFECIASTTLVTGKEKLEDVELSRSNSAKLANLRGLNHAIEEYNMADSPAVGKTSWTWKIHQNLTFSSTPQELLGWKTELSTYESYLDRAHFLAERDFSS